MTTTLIPPAKLSAKFKSLAERWKSETWMLSDTTAICTHPAYQRMIGMGPAAIPLILEELDREPGLWFWALRAITDEDPVPEKSQGDILAMSKCWTDWGRKQGWL